MSNNKLNVSTYNTDYSNEFKTFSAEIDFRINTSGYYTLAAAGKIWSNQAIDAGTAKATVPSLSGYVPFALTKIYIQASSNTQYVTVYDWDLSSSDGVATFALGNASESKTVKLARIQYTFLGRKTK